MAVKSNWPCPTKAERTIDACSLLISAAEWSLHETVTYIKACDVSRVYLTTFEGYHGATIKKIRQTDACAQLADRMNRDEIPPNAAIAV